MWRAIRNTAKQLTGLMVAGSQLGEVMRRTFIVVFAMLAVGPARADFTDSDAAAMAATSPAVAASLHSLETTIDSLPADVRDSTRDALLSDTPCIAYRRGETAASRQAVIDTLLREKFISDAAAARSLYGYPVRADKTCLHVVAPLRATPGSEEGSHHAWPGGLADHIAFNLHAAEDMVIRYRQLTDEPKAIDTAALTAAVLWHDWAKRLVLHWSEQGIVSYESPIGGTSSHHVIGLAEAMARGLPAKEIAIQACAHQAPDNDHDVKVVGWLRAAAIIAHADPVALGVLKPAEGGGFTMAVTLECRIHNMSDGNWVVGVPAVKHAQLVLDRLVPQLGYEAGAPRTRRFMLRALSVYGAERFDMVDDAEALKLLQALGRD